LAAVTIIALNPSSSFARARNSERQTEMAQVFTAMNRWVADGEGSLSNITYSGGTPVPTCAGTAPNFTNGINIPLLDISATLVSSGYLTLHPDDPDDASATDYYKVCYATSTTGPLTMYAPNTDGTRVTMTR